MYLGTSGRVHAGPYKRLPSRRRPEFWAEELEKVERDYRSWAAAVIFFQMAPNIKEIRQGFFEDWSEFRAEFLTTEDPDAAGLEHEELARQLLPLGVRVFQPFDRGRGMSEYVQRQ